MTCLTPALWIRALEDSPTGSSAEGRSESAEVAVVSPALLTSVVGCLAAAWSSASPDTQAQNGERVAGSLGRVLGSPRPWHVRVAALQAIQRFVQSQKLPTNSKTLIGWIKVLIPGGLMDRLPELHQYGLLVILLFRISFIWWFFGLRLLWGRCWCFA